jgi:hypothetical protein
MIRGDNSSKNNNDSDKLNKMATSKWDTCWHNSRNAAGKVELKLHITGRSAFIKDLGNWTFVLALGQTGRQAQATVMSALSFSYLPV